MQQVPPEDANEEEEALVTCVEEDVSLSRSNSSHSHGHPSTDIGSNIVLNRSASWLARRSATDAEEDLTLENDLEAGAVAIPKRRYFFRLASLNRPEMPIFILGSAAAAVHGALLPVCGLVFSRLIISFFKNDRHEMRKDASFWATMLVVLACGNFVVCPIQMGSFAVAGNRLVRRIRLLVFEKILRQEIGWFDQKENSR